MNFDFIRPFNQFENLYESCSNAEKYAAIDPTVSMTFSRKSLEFCIKFIYSTAVSNDTAGLTVYDMMSDYRFMDYIDDKGMMNEMHYIRKMGNAAVHEGNGKKDEAVDVLESLQYVVGELFIFLKLVDDYPEFKDPTLISETPVAPAPVKTVSSKTEQAAEAAKEEAELPKTIVADFSETMKRTVFDVRYKRDENENKKLFIKASLREANWPIVNTPNQAMPFSAGYDIQIDASDFIDYVLYDKNKKPLAIIELSETSQNPVLGRKKAKRVADKLAAVYGYAPVVYYTNGYNIECIDQLGFKQRRVFCFHALGELETLIQRRNMRKNIDDIEINDEITDRYYQKEAIRKVCDVYKSGRRRSIIVMATGTGKTRVAISTVDVLMRAGWVRNVLFLADRTSLVLQAQKNFAKLMPSLTTSVYTGTSADRDNNARLIFSTYQSMIHLINSDTREFGVGRFDLVIVDEAHRSIFSKYKYLFDYFDALMLGLTATPRFEQDKSTYEVFQTPSNEPDYSYDLEQALDDHFLVGYSLLDRTTESMQRGFKYIDLCKEEQEELEAALYESYDSTVVDRFKNSQTQHRGSRHTMINRDTIRVMLEDLMNNGLKVNDGKKIGKTIIFSRVHAEAEVIVEEFYKRYPLYGNNYCKLIDSQTFGSQAAIEKFAKADSDPQIVVSVDMMDTGVDIPEVLNLVFFKQTWSNVKFLQMIGRGTRLCKDLYGPGKDKKGFLVFDYYDNFRYFGDWDAQNWGTRKVSPYKYLFNTDKVAIYSNKLSILQYLQKAAGLNPFEQKYREELTNDFVSRTLALDNSRLEVQYNMPYVNKYRTRENWEFLNEIRMKEITDKIFPLFANEESNPKIRSFDNMMYSLEEYGVWLSERQPKKGVRTLQDYRLGIYNGEAVVKERMQELMKYTAIPEVAEKERLIQKVRDGGLFVEFSLEHVEHVRKDLRGLMVHIPDVDNTLIFELEDELIEKGIMQEEGIVQKTESYEVRVERYLNDSTNPIIAKIRNLEKLTDEEKDALYHTFTTKLGTEAEFAQWLGNNEFRPFVRSRVGISDEAINTNFGDFLQPENFNEEQMQYLQDVIQFARTNGDVTFTDLSNNSPFNQVDVMNLFGMDKIGYLKKLVKTIHDAII